MADPLSSQGGTACCLWRTAQVDRAAALPGTGSHSHSTWLISGRPPFQNHCDRLAAINVAPSLWRLTPVPPSMHLPSPERAAVQQCHHSSASGVHANKRAAPASKAAATWRLHQRYWGGQQLFTHCPQNNIPPRLAQAALWASQADTAAC